MLRLHKEFVLLSPQLKRSDLGKFIGDLFPAPSLRLGCLKGNRERKDGLQELEKH